MFRHAEAVIDRRIAASGVKPRGRAQIGGGNARELPGRFWTVPLLGDEGGPIQELVPVAAFAHEFLVDEPLGDDHMRHRRNQGDIGPGAQGQMIIGLDMRRAHQVDAARIDDDQFGALAQPLLHARGEYGMRVGRITADDQNDVGLVDRIEILRAGGSAEGLVEAIAGWRVTDARAGVDVVIAEARANELLNKITFLVRAARRGDATDGAATVFCLDLLKPSGGEGNRLVPRYDSPGLRDFLADHWIEHSVAVVGVAIGEAALDAAMAMIGLAVLPGNHAHDFLAAHFRLESAADAAIGAGGDRRMLGLAYLDDRPLLKRRRWASLNAGAAGHAFRLKERLAHASRDAAVETAAADG